MRDRPQTVRTQPGHIPLIGEYLARQIESTEIADYPAGNHVGATLRAWCTLPETFFAQAWYEVIGRKPIL